ncbi:uncharacterized protein LOC135842664 [Planococcus citri]|uniref:uncharacterized protein LOC135842664 n=1 Tax=Planococcus citri TaxID=170843 RepID=UPI0031FA2CF5
MYLIVLGSLLVSTLAVPSPQELSIKQMIDSEKKCLANYPPELKALLKEVKMKRAYPENPSNDFKCFMDCMGRELGIFDDQGNYHFEKLKAFTGMVASDSSVTADEIHQAVEACIKVDHELTCEKAHLYITCKQDKLGHAKLSDEMEAALNNH